MKKRATADGERVLLVKDAQGEFKVTIPADAKLTFGPAVPYAKKDGGYTGRSASEYALRIYRGTKENLLAVFTGVYTFRELSLPVARLVVREAGKSVWKSDETGYSMNTEVKKNQGFIDVNLLNAGEPE